MDRVGDGGRLLLLGLPEVVVCEQHRGAVVCGDTAGTERRDREEGDREKGVSGYRQQSVFSSDT